MTIWNRGIDLKERFPDIARYAFNCITLLLFLIIIYGNSFQASFHYDDYPNIVDNPNVHPKMLTWDELTKSFHGTDLSQSQIKRPFSYFTLALNYYLGGKSVFGYHVVNFAIHYLSALFLFLLFYNTLRSHGGDLSPRDSAYSIAILATFLWATHPIQVTAVTYIVQRMASLAAMFYILAMYLYVKGRTAQRKAVQISFFIGCAVSGLAAMASKQNAAMLPVSLYLYEIIVIQGISKRVWKKVGLHLLLLIAVVALIGEIYTNFHSLLQGYQHRPFTLEERLMTESRVFFLYLLWIFHPVGRHFSIIHDISISTGLLDPWTTGLSILGVLALLGCAVGMAHKRPLLSYAILFFFINHLIEGSIIPLELIYEHRNYLPSTFLFLFIAILLFSVCRYFSYQKALPILISGVLVFLLVSQAHTTYLYNIIMKSDLSLWTDAQKKAPGRKVAQLNLAVSLLKADKTEQGVKHLHHALKLPTAMNPKTEALPNFNLGKFYLSKGRLDKAEEHLLLSLKLYPVLGEAWYSLACLYLRNGFITEAENSIQKAIALKSGLNAYTLVLSYNLLSQILIIKGDIMEATEVALLALRLNTNETVLDLHLTLGNISKEKKEWRKALYHYQRFLYNSPHNTSAILSLIEICNTIGEKGLLKTYIFYYLYNDYKYSKNPYNTSYQANRKNPLLLLKYNYCIIETLINEIFIQTTNTLEQIFGNKISFDELFNSAISHPNLPRFSLWRKFEQPPYHEGTFPIDN